VWSDDLSINYNKKISKTLKPSKILAENTWKTLGKYLKKIKERTQKSISYNI